MKKLILLLPFALTLLSCNVKSSQKYDSVTFQAMDTIMTIKITGENTKEILRLAQEEIQNLEKIISTTDKQSQLFRINQISHDSQNIKDIPNEYDNPPDYSVICLPISKEIMELTTVSFEYAQKTNGAFNPALYPIILEWGFTTGKYKIPSDEKIRELLPLTDYKQISLDKVLQFIILKPHMLLDFGGIAKGWAGDKVAEIFKQNNITSAIVNLGGSTIQTIGINEDSGIAWKIGIKNPWQSLSEESDSEPVAAYFAKDKAIATSAGYERSFTGEDGKTYIHIFNPTTGRPVENDIASVTIIADSACYADMLSTSLFVMGSEKAIQFWKEHRDFDFILLLKDKSFIYSAPLKENLMTINPERFSSLQEVE